MVGSILNNKKYKAIISDSLIFLIVVLLFFWFVSSTAYTANTKLEKHFLQEENQIENVGSVENDEEQTNTPLETLPTIMDTNKPTEPIIEYQNIEYATNEICVIGGQFVDAIRATVFTDVKLVRVQTNNENWIMNDLYQLISENDGISVYVITIKANEYPSSFDLWPRLNSLAETFQNKHFVYLNIGPVDDTKQPITNESIVQYNKDAETNLLASWQIVDLYSYLLTDGYETGKDGISYDAYTNISIFSRLIKAVQIQTIPIEKGV